LVHSVSSGAGRGRFHVSFRAIGITAYLKNGWTLEKAASIANHASTRTTQLYDRRSDEVNLDEIEWVGFELNWFNRFVENLTGRMARKPL
jgi:hypothetical protein